MTKTIIVFASVLAMGCASAQLKSQIDEQKNMMLVKDKKIVSQGKEIEVLKTEIDKRDKMIAKLDAEMDFLQTQMVDLSADASYLEDLEPMYEDMVEKYSELEAKVDRLEAEKTVLKNKLESKAHSSKAYSSSDQTMAELGALLDDPEGVISAKLGKIEEAQKITVIQQEETEKKAVFPTYPVVPPMMPYGGMGGMPVGMPMAASPMATFVPFPMSTMGYTYSPPPDNTLNVKISGEAVNEGTYFLVKLDGKEITFPTEPPRIMMVSGKGVPKSLLPAGVDAYIPVDNTGPYTVTLQACVMNGKKCVPSEPACTKKVKDVQKAMVLARSCD
jgi:hypothetical protein